MDYDAGYWLIRLMLQRGLAFIYLMAFLVALNQFRNATVWRDHFPK